MRSILTSHARRYPDWEPVDLYKLIHQAALGSEHALAEEARVREALRQEIAHLGEGPQEQLVDPISPDGRIVRVHLRPFAKLHLRQDLLARAFLQTGSEVRPSMERLAAYAAIAAQLVADRIVDFSASHFAAVMAEMQSGGFPAAHHSPRFMMRYRPAYRVVARELLPEEVAMASWRATDAVSPEGPKG
jgi:hypothetical protein